MLAGVVALVDDLIGTEPFAVAGFSYGGLLAAALTAARQEQVSGLFLLAPVTIGPADQRSVESHDVFSDGTLDLDTLTDQERSFYQDTAVIQSQESWEAFRRVILPGLETANWGTVAALTRDAGLDPDPYARIATYRRPISVVLGRNDTRVGFRDALALFAEHPSASISILSPAGHNNLHIEQREAFAGIFRQWLSRVSS